MDDDEAVRLLLQDLQEESGYAVRTARSGEEALQMIRVSTFDIIITDLRLSGMHGLELVKEVKAIDPGIDLVVMTGYASVNSAVESMKAGAIDYITKPFNSDHIKMVVQKSLERREYQRLAQEREFYKVLSSIDGLTELYNYRYMHQYLKIELERERRYKRHLLNLRTFLADLAKERPTSRLDEAFLALVMLGSALAFSAVFTGPWGALKNAAYAIGSLPWLAYGLGFLTLNLLLLPGLFRLAVWAAGYLAGERMPWRKAAARWGETLLPLGLAAWIAFTISFAFPKFNLVLGVLSDPLGWGWNLLGLNGLPASPDISAFSAFLQVVVVLGGLFLSSRTARKLAGARQAAAYPILAFCLAFSLAIVWLLVG